MIFHLTQITMSRRHSKPKKKRPKEPMHWWLAFDKVNEDAVDVARYLWLWQGPKCIGAIESVIIPKEPPYTAFLCYFDDEDLDSVLLKLENISFPNVSLSCLHIIFICEFSSS